MKHGPSDGDPGFIFSCSFFIAFNFRCFLRSRCFMEMWCPDDEGRDSWVSVGPRTGGEHDSTLRSLVRLLAEENGASPDCIIVVVLTDSPHSVFVHARQPSAPNPTCNEFKSCTNLEAWARATRPKIVVVVVASDVC